MQCNRGSEETRKSNHHLVYRSVTEARLAECPHHGNWFPMPSKIARIHSSRFMLSDCQSGVIISDSSEFETWVRIQSNSSHWKADNTNAKYPKQPQTSDKICAKLLFSVFLLTKIICALSNSMRDWDDCQLYLYSCLWPLKYGQIRNISPKFLWTDFKFPSQNTAGEIKLEALLYRGKLFIHDENQGRIIAFSAL